MRLVRLLLPLYDNEGQKLLQALYGQVRQELVERFGGLTACERAPVSGLWEDEGTTVRDDLVSFEVMVEGLNGAWWAEYRADLGRRFQPEELIIRAQVMQRLYALGPGRELGRITPGLLLSCGVRQCPITPSSRSRPGRVPGM
jgi:hypothetical protein